MIKIPTLFMRDEADRSRLTREQNPACAWLFDDWGAATPTRKWDGTACMVRTGRLYARYDAKNGKVPPAGFEACQEADPITGHMPGWIPVLDQPHLKWHRLAWIGNEMLPDGTYELCGPAINGNPEQLRAHDFYRHGDTSIAPFCPTYDNCERLLSIYQWEGFVFHGPDGRMAKLKRRDFGLPWPVK